MNEILMVRIFIYTISLGASIICLVNFRKLNKSFRWLGIFLLAASLSQITAYALMVTRGSNVDFYNVVILVNIILIFNIFVNINGNRRTKIWLTGIFAFGFLSTLSFVWSGIANQTFSVQGLALMSITVALGALIILFGMMRNPLNSSPLKMGWLWLLMGFLFYYTSTFSYWTATEFTSQVNAKKSLQNVNIVLIIIFYLILLTAIIIQLKFGDANNNPKPRRSIKSSSFLQ
ncbi:hypothetical protein G3O08_09070 [Cryomorpha ignava]|uniref:Uncharacterized protein n=1 Tax=Cryomorpha ignava TaxID=101383 RepID=A0A7K3WS21_9FLAO|nr:hypothetical protein [Cryomorpha ignava]NEN23652.1 hypothetical protein [Cryomorpha ignava]